VKRPPRIFGTAPRGRDCPGLEPVEASPRLNWPKRVVFSVLPTVLVLGATELGLRVANLPWMFCARTRACPGLGGAAGFMTQRSHNFSPEKGEPLFVYDPQLFWWPRAHVQGFFWRTPDVRTNALGLRERPLERSGRRNVLVVGDSVVWGVLVPSEERFSDKAAAELAKRAGIDGVQVINAGVVGYSSFQVLQLLKQRALRWFHPEVVVMCVGLNDCWLSTMSDREQYARNMKLLPRIQRLLMRSDLFVFLHRYALEVIAWARTGRNPSGLSFLFGQSPGALRVLRNSLDETEANIGEAGDLIEGAGGGVVIVLELARGPYPRNWNPESFRHVRTRLARFARRRGWATIDVATLTRYPHDFPLDRVLLDFCHLTPEASGIVGRWVGEAAAGLLRSSQDLLPEHSATSDRAGAGRQSHF
jgi:hypothetical protein